MTLLDMIERHPELALLAGLGMLLLVFAFIAGAHKKTRTRRPKPPTGQGKK